MKSFKNRFRALTAILIFVLSAAAAYFLFAGLYAKTADRQYSIIVVLKSTSPSMEYWQTVSAGVDSAAREFNVNADIEGTQDETDVKGQIQILEKAIAAKPDAIVLAAADYNAVNPVAEEIRNAGIKLITIDSGLNSNLPESFIATDNVQAGEKAGKYLAGIIPAQSKIAIISHVKDSATAIQREQGVKLGLPKQQLGQIVGTYFSGSDEQKAYQITKELLTKNPGIKGIAGLNEPSAAGAGDAISELGLAGKVKLVGFDSSVHEIELMEAGIIQATVVQKPFNIGYLGIKTAVQAINGERVEANIDTGSQLITRNDMYTDVNQKLLFPFINQ